MCVKRRGWGITSPPFSLMLAVIFLIHLARHIGAIVYMQSNCGGTVTSQGDVVYSQTALYYQPIGNCTFTIMPPDQSQRLKVKFVYFDIGPAVVCNSDRLVVDGASPSHGVQQRGYSLCGRQLPPSLTSSGAWLKFNLISGDNIAEPGRGFQFVFTAIYQVSRCIGPQLFHCANGVCISFKLRCDSVDHCGDGSDEVKTKDGACTDRSDAKPSADNLYLAEILFSALGVLFTVLFVATIGWQCLVFMRNKITHRVTPRTSKEPQPDPSRRQLIEEGDLSGRETSCNNVGLSWESITPATSEETPNDHDATQAEKFSISRVRDDKTELGDEETNVEQRDGRFNIGRFSVQSVHTDDYIEHGILYPAAIAMRDPTKTITQSTMRFLADVAVGVDLERGPSRVKFVLEENETTDGHERTTPSPVGFSARPSGSILKKNRSRSEGQISA